MRIKLIYGKNIFEKDITSSSKSDNNTNEKEYTVDNIVSEIAKETEITEEDVRRLLLFIRFAMYKKASMEKTKFAKDYGISNFMDLYEWVKETKRLLKNDMEKDAFERIRKLVNSAGSVAGAWFFDTWVKYMNDKTEIEKYISATKYGDAFIIKSLGIYMDNLMKFRKVINKLNKYADVVFEFSQREKATGKEVDTKDIENVT